MEVFRWCRHAHSRNSYLQTAKEIKEIFNDEFLLKVRNKATLFEKRNKFAKDLMTTKYRVRVVKPKKGKGSFKRKKKIYKSRLIRVLLQLVE